MKIIADKNIPFLKGIAEAFGEVVYLAGADFTKQNIKEADVLITRTVARFDENNLEGSNVKLICSATIGYDHIDTDYCDQHNIEWHNAPGCNSGSVQQYVASALIAIAHKKQFSLQGKTIGIVGLGNVGKKVAVICEVLGMRVLKNDPPREELEGKGEFYDLATIKQEADIITFHTPLTKEGKYSTHHLADDSFFSGLKKTPIIINSARGGIVDTTAIKKALQKKMISGAVIDCWENEPNIDIEYMKMVDIATPHIAGYSADGKANATRMSLESIARFKSIPIESVGRIVIPEMPESVLDYENIGNHHKVEELIFRTYDILKDHNALLNDPKDFNRLRSDYPLRREYLSYTVQNVSNISDKEKLRKIGFNIS